MTENTSSAVGRAAIDAYLDSVEHALLAAHAPRGDRVQVLQDLESQIADMLAVGPQPLTEEIVQSVIAKLEPPSHFATTYGNDSGNGNASGPAWHIQIAPRPVIRWPIIAQLSCACLCLWLPVVFIARMMFPVPHGAVLALVALMLLVGFAFSPFALWKAVEQLRAQPDRTRDRGPLLKSALIYCVVAPLLLIGMFALITHGYIFIPIGLAAFIYMQYLLIRRLHRHLNETLPLEPAGDATAHTPAPSVSTAMSMPAV